MTEPISSSPAAGVWPWALRSLAVFGLTNFVQIVAGWIAVFALIMALDPSASAAYRAFLSVFFGIAVMTGGALYPLGSLILSAFHRARFAPLAHATWLAASGAYAFTHLPPNIRVSDPPIFVVLAVTAIAGYATYRATATFQLASLNVTPSPPAP